MIKVLVINPRIRTITEAELPNVYPAAKDLIGGWLTIATAFPNGDTLYVDDEGLLKDGQSFFRVAGMDQPIAGTGVLTGREDDDGEDGTDTADVRTTVEELAALVSWLDPEDFAAWLADNRSRPAVTVTFFDSGDEPITTVVSTWGDALGSSSTDEGTGS